MMPRPQCTCEDTARVEVTPGTTLAALLALHEWDTFNRAQVAYLIALAYRTGRIHGFGEDLADMVGTWEEHAPPPKLTREQRVAERLAEMERLAGPATYMGGPVDWETGLPVGGAA